MSDFKMPQLGADMAAGTLVEWQKKPGETVSRGDIMAVVETDKGAIEIEVFEDGIVDALLVEPGTKIPVGTVLAVITDNRESTPGPAEKISQATLQKPAPNEAPSGGKLDKEAAETAPAKEPPSGGRLRISPAAARLAAERGVDIRAVSGTGPSGAIRLADIDVLAAESTPDTQDTPNTPNAPALAMRRAIAAAMGKSNREIPHYYLSTAIDMTRALDWLSAANQQRPVTERLLYSVLLIKAVARALEKFPELNGFWRDDAFEAGGAIHIGWAISLRGGGLLAPAIRNANDMDFDQLMVALRDLVKRARSFRLRGSEFTDPTITVTSLGDQGVENVYGVIYPPQVALVGFGRIAERAWVVGGAVQPRPIIEASLAADHRASDGHRGGQFLRTIEQILQEPESL